jgi:hypothetical protein
MAEKTYGLPMKTLHTGRYLVMQDSMDWDSAYSFCVEKGMKLVILESHHEFDLIITEVRSTYKRKILLY